MWSNYNQGINYAMMPPHVAYSQVLPKNNELNTTNVTQTTETPDQTKTFDKPAINNIYEYHFDNQPKERETLENLMSKDSKFI